MPISIALLLVMATVEVDREFEDQGLRRDPTLDLCQKERDPMTITLTTAACAPPVLAFCSPSVYRDRWGGERTRKPHHERC